MEALAYFKGKGLELEVIDVRTEPNRMDELIRLSGQTKTPTLTHGKFVVADFDIEELEIALAQNPEAKEELGL